MRRASTGILLVCGLMACNLTQAQRLQLYQDSVIEPVAKLSNKSLCALKERYSRLGSTLQRQTLGMLNALQTREQVLQARLAGKVHGPDSIRISAQFAEAQRQYQQYQQTLRSDGAGAGSSPAATGGSLKEYLSGLDSMQTSLKFLSEPGLQAYTGAKLQTIAALSGQLQSLQGKFEQANDIQAFIRQRERQLKESLSGYSVTKQLTGINSEAYYYQARLAGYKTILNDPSKYQEVFLSAVRQIPAFQRYWQSNSYFSRLFPNSPHAGTPLALAGLQTREEVQEQVRKQLGMTVAPAQGGAGEGAGYLQSQMQQAQSQLSALKSKLTELGSGSGPFGGGNSNMTIPDVPPNSQHTKSFFGRLSYSLMIQNNPSSTTLPAISNLGLNVGYKLSDRATIGVGAGYLLGLGNGLNHIRLSNQGMTARSFMDIKAKGSIWITGGFEYSYYQQFFRFDALRNAAVWQKSALIGISKKYKIGKKENSLQLLYNLLAASESPGTSAFQLRLGWGL